jgi:hypothetical protein
MLEALEMSSVSTLPAVSIEVSWNAEASYWSDSERKLAR